MRHTHVITYCLISSICILQANDRLCKCVCVSLWEQAGNVTPSEDTQNHPKQSCLYLPSTNKSLVDLNFHWQDFYSHQKAGDISKYSALKEAFERLHTALGLMMMLSVINENQSQCGAGITWSNNNKKVDGSHAVCFYIITCFNRPKKNGHRTQNSRKQFSCFSACSTMTCSHTRQKREHMYLSRPLHRAIWMSLCSFGKYCRLWGIGLCQLCFLFANVKSGQCHPELLS